MTAKFIDGKKIFECRECDLPFLDEGRAEQHQFACIALAETRMQEQFFAKKLKDASISSKRKLMSGD